MSKEVMKNIEFGLMKLWTFETIAYFANVPPEDLVLYIEIINKTKKQKYHLVMDPLPRIDYEYVMEYPLTEIEYPGDNDIMKIMICSDKHIGNIHDNLRYIKRMYKEAEERGVKLVLDCGDLIDPPDISETEKSMARSRCFSRTVSRLAQKHPKNLPTYFVTGNNESKMFWQSGISPGKVISEVRKDIVCLDDNMFASIKIRNLVINMSHGLREKKKLSVVKHGAWHPYLLRNGPQIVCHGHFHEGKIMQVSDETLLCMAPAMIKGLPMSAYRKNDRGAIFLTIDEKKGGFFIESELVLDNTRERKVERTQHYLIKKR